MYHRSTIPDTYDGEGHSGKGSQGATEPAGQARHRVGSPGASRLPACGKVKKRREEANKKKAEEEAEAKEKEASKKKGGMLAP